MIILSSGGDKVKPARSHAPAVKPCALAVPRQLSYNDVDHKRISLLRASDYSEVVNLDVIALNVSRHHGRYTSDVSRTRS